MRCAGKLVVGTMIEKQTPNTVELANLLLLDTERQDMREQWLRHLFKESLAGLCNPDRAFCAARVGEAGKFGQTIPLSLDQTDLGDAMALLMIGLRIGDPRYP